MCWSLGIELRSTSHRPARVEFPRRADDPTSVPAFRHADSSRRRGFESGTDVALLATMTVAAARFEDLVAAVERLVPSEHLCMSYGTEEELFAAVAPFVRRGLEQHEACVVIAEEPVRSSIV